jgi:hypothetical protein
MQDSTKHDGPWSFLPWLATLLPQEKTKKEIKCKGIDITLTAKSKPNILTSGQGCYVTLTNI